MKTNYGLFILAIGVPALATAFVFACSSSDSSAPPIGPDDCDGPGCPDWDSGTTSDVVKVKDSGTLSDVDNFDGARADAFGILWMTRPPKFDIAEGETNVLPFPATVHMAIRGIDFVTEYLPEAGFSFGNVPTCNSATEACGTLLVLDPDGLNDVIPAVAAIPMPASQLDVHMAPKQYWDGILAGLEKPLAFDPNKGQVLFHIHKSKLDPMPLSGIKVVTNRKYEAVVYDSSSATSGWAADPEAGTGPLGIALVVNVDVAPYPGETVKVQYSKASANGETESFHLCAGALAKAIWFEAQMP